MREGRDDGLDRAAVRQQGHNGYHHLVQLVRPIERGSFGFGKGLVAPLALVAALFLTMDDDVILARSAVGNVVLPIPRILQISDTVRDLSAAMLLNICTSFGVEAFGRPPDLPLLLADSTPARVRSLIMSLSNSAIEPKM